jgi:hypothetical protein
VKRLPEAKLRALPLIASSGVQMVLGLTDTSSAVLVLGDDPARRRWQPGCVGTRAPGAAHAEAFPSRVDGMSCAQFAYRRIDSVDPTNAPVVVATQRRMTGRARPSNLRL